jgi:Low-density lipoprotein receptor repeat class B
MKHTRILPAMLRSAMKAGLFLIALVAALGLMPGWELTSRAQACQQEGACFVFEAQGYITDPTTGQTTIAFRVTNKCRNLVAYVAIGTGGFTRVAPRDGSVYNGDLGIYDVAWTRAGGGGFEGIKFTPTLKNFANSASEVFTIVVANFNPATAVAVRGKAGSAQETYNFLLSQTCGTPTPTRRLYWANVGTNTIGRGNLSGQTVNQSFISVAHPPFGMAVDSRYLYWASNQNHSIGRADLDGQNANENFITNVPYAYWVAVDSSHIYWTDAVTNSIGRADLDGQNVNQNFIPAMSPMALTVDSSHIYWTNLNPESIGRADLDGQNVINSFISGEFGLYGVAVDSSHIYWADLGYNRIGRADLDGQNVNLSFISAPGSGPRGVAVDRSHIYWTNSYTGTIGQAGLDGQNVNQSLITGGYGPFSLAIDPE